MPIREYECSVCGHKLERIEKLNDRTKVLCPLCLVKYPHKDTVMRQAISVPAHPQFKGSGFHATDYPK